MRWSLLVQGSRTRPAPTGGYFQPPSAPLIDMFSQGENAANLLTLEAHRGLEKNTHRKTWSFPSNTWNPFFPRPSFFENEGFHQYFVLACKICIVEDGAQTPHL